MTHTKSADWYSGSDKQDILNLALQLEGHLSDLEKQQLARLERERGRESDAYLEEVMRLYKIYMLGVFEGSDEARPGKGHGRRKEGAHSEGRHK